MNIRNITIIVLAILLNTVSNAQENAFHGKWKIASYRIEINDKPSTLFHKDSTNNEVDYSPLTIKFMDNGAAERSYNDNVMNTSSWSFSEIDDTLSIGEKKLRVLNQSNDKFTTISFDIQLVYNGNDYVLDTAYHLMDYEYVPVLGTFDNSTNVVQLLELFPNPAQSRVKLKFTNTNQGSSFIIKVAQVDGREVLNIVCDHSLDELDISQLDKGMYVVSCISKEGGQSEIQPLLIK